MRVYVCVYVCVCVHACMRVCVCARACLGVCACVWVCVRAGVFERMRTRARLHAHTLTYHIIWADGTFCFWVDLESNDNLNSQDGSGRGEMGEGRGDRGGSGG